MNSQVNKSNRARPVLCMETMTVYPSIAQAAKQLEISAQHISYACQGRMKTANGYHWQYVEQASGKPRYRVYCLETDKKYIGATFAAKEHHIGAYAIMQCVLGKAETAGGLHWYPIEQDAEGNDYIVYTHTSKNGKTYIGQTGGAR